MKTKMSLSQDTSHPWTKKCLLKGIHLLNMRRKPSRPGRQTDPVWNQILTAHAFRFFIFHHGRKCLHVNSHKKTTRYCNELITGCFLPGTKNSYVNRPLVHVLYSLDKCASSSKSSDFYGMGWCEKRKSP